ncbi:MAG TPA: PKD domain-containing protein [Candidatus Desulfaltia sp.]|nr:PKD domain-containing protein [Candidatus Desulfaltia sp.]
MKLRQGATAFLLFIILLNPLPVYAGHFFESNHVEDDSGDTLNFERCFYEGKLEFSPMEMDIKKVDVFAVEDLGTGDVRLFLDVTLNKPPLPYMSYTIEFGLDVDRDPTTGASQPAVYYGGMGVDYDVGVEVYVGTVTSTWVDRYEDGSWVRLGETTCQLIGETIWLGLPLDLIPHPLDFVGAVFFIQGEGLDIASGLGGHFHYTPEALLSEVPQLGEGSECLLDASGSYTKYDGFSLYEWDLDGDGVYDESSDAPTFTALYQKDGVYPVTVRVTDTEGFTSTHIQTVTVLNLPPTGLEAGYTGDPKVDEELTFTAAATDPGGDSLTYEWDFGDDSTGEGAEVSHAYTGTGFHIVMVTVRDDAGAEVTTVFNVDVAPAVTQPTDNGGGAGTPPIDPLLVVLILLLGIGGVIIYNMIKGRKKEEPPKKDEEKEKDFCEEHPEVVEEETHKCDDALIDLESAIGDVQDNFDEAEPRWRSNANEVARLLVQWDGVISLIAHWTKSEKALQADAEKVQKVANLVTSAGGAAKTAFKEGGEAVMKELGKDIAKDMAKGIAGELSDTVGTLLDMEDWAIREIGLGIAKGLTGIDPKGNAVKLRQNSEILLTQLLSWVDHSEAWNLGRRPPDTLPSMIKEAEAMLNALDDALKSFEDAVKDFKCVTCKVPDYLQEEMDELRKKLEKWKKTFSDLEKEVQKRINQARGMYGRKDLYESPYEYLHKAARSIERIDRARGGS